MVVDEDVVHLIRLLDGEHTPQQLANLISKNTQTSKKELITNINIIIKELERKKVAYHKKPRTQAISKKPVLENITINVTRRCNLKCSHCFLDSNNKIADTLSIHDIEKFLLEGKRYIMKNINFSILGGEPLLNKNLTLEIAKLAKIWGGEAVVSTNGILIDDKFANEARDNNLIVQVSLEGSSPEINDQIRGKSCFEKVKNGIETLVRNKTHTILNMVVHDLNKDDIINFYNFSKEIGANEVRFIPLNIMGRARSSELVTIQNVQLMNILLKILKDIPEAKDRMKRDYFTILKTVCSLSNKRRYCGTGLKTILIDSDGETYPCPNHQFPEFRLGNINDKSFNDIWLQSPVIKQIRDVYDINQNNKECIICPIKYWCMGGCRGETYDNTKEMRSKSIRCEELRKAIIEMFWILETEGEIVENSKLIEYF